VAPATVVLRVVEPVPVVVVAEPPAVIEGELAEVEPAALGVAVVLPALDPTEPLPVLLAPVPIVLAVVPVPAVVEPEVPAATVPAGHGSDATVVDGVPLLPVAPLVPVVLFIVPEEVLDVPTPLFTDAGACVVEVVLAGAPVVELVLAGAPVVVVVEPPTGFCAPTDVGVPTLV
jgi:hypothetical protein